MGAARATRPDFRGQTQDAKRHWDFPGRLCRALGRARNRAVAYPLGGCAIILGALLVTSSPASAESRIALVVGNSAYATGRLANPRRDAEAVARTLLGVGFDVTLVLDADREGMRKAVLAFGRKLRSSDGVGVFYFAGHGVQFSGQNYLLPIDADVATETEVALQALNLSELLNTMRTSATRVSIAILDACRNNPFPVSARGIEAGLAQVSAPAGTLIAYATAPGEVALDGEAGNSPYTMALTRQIPMPGLSIEDMFKRTREQVLKVTAGRQTPWEHSSLVGSFTFKPRSAEPEAATGGVDPDTAVRLKEVRDWAAIKDSNDPDVFRRHVATYPGGAFEELASYKIALIGRQPTGWSAILTSALNSAPVPPRERSEAERSYEQAIGIEGAAQGRRLAPEAAAQVAALYRRAADLGLVPAMYALGRALERGDGVAKDETAAAAWFERAVNGGSAPAMSALGTLNEYGRGVPKDLVQAMRLYRLAADANDAHGMACFAYLLAEGKGISKDAAAARRWYQRSAELGNPRAMFNLALMLLRKQGGPQDTSSALTLLRSAAEKSHTASLRELAAMHDDGRHVPRDASLAAQYLLAAARASAGQSVLKARGEAWTIATRLELQRRLQVEGVYTGRLNGALDGETLEALLDYGAGRGQVLPASNVTAAGPPTTRPSPPPPFASGVMRSRLGVASLP